MVYNGNSFLKLLTSQLIMIKQNTWGQRIHETDCLIPLIRLVNFIRRLLMNPVASDNNE